MPDIKQFILEARNQGVSDDEIYDYLDQKGMLQGALEQAKQPQTSGTLTTPLREGISGLKTLYGGGEQGIAQKLGGTFSEAAKGMIQGGFSGDITKANIPKIAGSFGKGVFRATGDLAGTVYAPIGAAVGATGVGKLYEKIGGAIANSELGNAITDLPAVQEFAMKYPNAAEDFGRALNIIFAGKEKGKIEPSTAVPRTIQQGRTVIGAPKAVVTKIQTRLGEKVDVRAKAEIDNLIKSKRSIEDKTKELEAQRVPVKDMMSERQIYEGLKVEKGTINPDKAISVIEERLDRAMAVTTNLAPEIDKYNYAPISRETLRQKAYNYAGQQGELPADVASIRKAIDAQINALSKELKPSQIDAVRGQAFNSSRNAKGQLKRTSEYAAIENAARDLVFDAADRLPMAAKSQFAGLRDYVRQNIRLKNYLDTTIRGQKAKGGRLGAYVGRGIGAVAGSQFGWAGAILGAEAGGKVANILMNNQLGSSVKMRMIKQITDNPLILQEAGKLLRLQQQYQSPYKALPAPTTIYGEAWKGGKSGVIKPDQVIPYAKQKFTPQDITRRARTIPVQQP